MSSSELNKDQTFILKPSQEMMRNHYGMSSQSPIHTYTLLIQVFRNHSLHLSAQETGAVS